MIQFNIVCKLSVPTILSLHRVQYTKSHDITWIKFKQKGQQAFLSLSDAEGISRPSYDTKFTSVSFIPDAGSNIFDKKYITFIEFLQQPLFNQVIIIHTQT
jgi:hypothetical protein